MILDAIIDAVILLIKLIFDLLPNIPAMSATITTYISQFTDLIFQGIGLIDILIDLNILKIVVIGMLAVNSYQYVYKITMFVLKKIPMLNIH